MFYCEPHFGLEKRWLAVAIAISALASPGHGFASDAAAGLATGPGPVAVRAAGYQPDWTFAVDPQGRLSFAEDRGSSLVLTAAPVVGEPARPGGMIYGARTGAQEIVAEIAAVGCTDARSGKRLTHHVTIHFQGREYRGCGEAVGVPARQTVRAEGR
ncbi:MAG: hypothetical protein ACXWUK_11135 [Burkholderiales bacterium]